jgi:hypothetical protein
MIRFTIVITLLVLLGAPPAYAQLAVVDPANLAQAILIVQRTQRHLEELNAQYLTILRMAAGIGRMDRYRTPPIALSQHDASRWTFGRPWIAALNVGDPSGAAYLATAMPLERPDAASWLTGPARRAFERRYANIQIADSVAMIGSNQIRTTRGFYDALQRGVRLNRTSSSGVVSRSDGNSRQDRRGELLGGAGRRRPISCCRMLEQLLARSKHRATRRRNREHAALTWRDADAVNRAFRAGAGDALRTWRQP